ncbi:MAG: haloacid dehalogenase type II [Sterolibacteriaceae bacterium MAG5]|nr:haloacid dehalogenase type II [Candidatus Nitricoxidireducens bremensis]
MIKAILFDAYGTLFDVHSVGLMAEQLFPGKGAEISALWRAKQIEYSHLRTLSGRYKNFWDLTRDALDHTLARLALQPTAEQAEKLMSQYACLTAFPENLGALKALKKLGLPLGILSNGTPRMLDIAIKSAGMAGLFDHVLSVEAVGQYKTAPAAYQLGPDALGLPAKQILFVSSNGWDAAGATWFGYTSYWINRGGHPVEHLDVQPTATGRLLTDVAEFVKSNLK